MFPPAMLSRMNRKMVSTAVWTLFGRPCILREIHHIVTPVRTDTMSR
jgi:hypothetical protein